MDDEEAQFLIDDEEEKSKKVTPDRESVYQPF